MEHTNKNRRVVEACSFGAGHLANTVAAILNEIDDRRITNKASGLFADYQRTVNELRNVRDRHTYETLMRLVRVNTLAKILGAGFPKSLETHLSNLIVRMYREEMRLRGGIPRSKMRA